MNLTRGEIWLVDLTEEGRGSEQKLIRPVIIMQNNKGNFFSPTVSIIPLTSVDKKWMPTHVTLHKTKGLKELSTALSEQVTTKSKTRFIQYLGYVESSEMILVENALRIQLGL